MQLREHKVVIYRITNNINGRIYVGKTERRIEERWARHQRDALTSHRPLYNSIRKHGAENFSIDILEVCATTEELTEREKYWIKELNAEHSFGNYNMTEGGEGGFVLKHNPNRAEIYKRQALSRTGQKRTPEQRANMASAATKRQQSYTTEQKAEIAAKISTTNKERGIAPPEYTKWKAGQVGTFTGKQHSAASKEKMGKARLGMTYEQVFGEEKAAVEREKRRQQFSGESNPNYVEFPPKTKADIIQHIQSTKTSMANLEYTFGISSWVLRKWVRELGYTDFRKFCKAIKQNEHTID